MKTNPLLALVPGLGVMIVAAAAVVYWRRRTHLEARWFWAGAGLWTVAVALKVVCALLTNTPVIHFFKQHLAYPLLILAGGLFLGIQSSLFEIGLTLLAVLIWRRLGRDAARAIGIGVGAGAFEAFLLGVFGLIAVLAALAGVHGTESIRQEFDAAARTTPLFWLVGPVERIIAILCHASSRAMVLLGVAKKRPVAVLGGFLIFTLLDGVAGGAIVSGKLDKISLWWIELALLPFALVSIPILKGCYAAPGQTGRRPGRIHVGRPTRRLSGAVAPRATLDPQPRDRRRQTEHRLGHPRNFSLPAPNPSADVSHREAVCYALGMAALSLASFSASESLSQSAGQEEQQKPTFWPL